jgi:enamine deaminase RidA (YjgF/YER057c/UK114 family)
LGLAAGGVTVQSALASEHSTWKGRRNRNRGPFGRPLSPQGGKTVWLAGQTATEELNHKSIVGDFDGQVRTVFALLDQTLRQADGSLRNMVTMTYPASALITVSNFARPGILIEIQGVAVIAEK